MSQSHQHISFEQLADMVEERLTEAEIAEASQHLTACDRCARQAAELKRVVVLMRADDSVDAPRDVLFETIQMFNAPRADGREPSFLKRIFATLSFDSKTLRPAFGVRSGQTAQARQVLFSAGDFDIDLRLAPGGTGWAVSGQVLGPCESGGRVEMLKSDDGAEIVAEADLNDLCEFTLPTVASGLYRLRLQLGAIEVRIPELELSD